ncbi:MAG: hypothetical protein ACM35G_15475, partial [Planctomycetaceae bacterium]
MAPPIPQGPCPVFPRLAQEFEPWRQAAYYKAVLDRAVAREAQLHQESARLQAQLRLRAPSGARPTPGPPLRAPLAPIGRRGHAANNAGNLDPNAALIP